MAERMGNGTWQLLESDDDILLLDKDTFTVGRLKELLIEEFRVKVEGAYVTKNNQNEGWIYQYLTPLSAGHKTINRTELIWQSILNCQFLKIGSKGWEQGKVKIQVIYKGKTEASLEFSPNEPPKPESPLDDLRELPEYKQ